MSRRKEVAVERLKELSGGEKMSVLQTLHKLSLIMRECTAAAADPCCVRFRLSLALKAVLS